MLKLQRHLHLFVCYEACSNNGRNIQMPKLPIYSNYPFTQITQITHFLQITHFSRLPISPDYPFLQISYFSRFPISPDFPMSKCPHHRRINACMAHMPECTNVQIHKCQIPNGNSNGNMLLYAVVLTLMNHTLFG